MAEEYITRQEFDRFCAAQNGALNRIETGIRDINRKLDALAEADTHRVTWDAYDRHREECRQEFARLRARPSWAVAAMVAFLSSATVGLLVLVLSRAL